VPQATADDRPRKEVVVERTRWTTVVDRRSVTAGLIERVRASVIETYAGWEEGP